jgi:ABC-type phosphate transport system auxiliary subunit
MNKLCKNQNCTAENPEFNQGRLICKKCHAKQCAELNKKRRERIKAQPPDIQEEIQQLQTTIDLLTKRLHRLTAV